MVDPLKNDPGIIMVYTVLILAVADCTSVALYLKTVVEGTAVIKYFPSAVLEFVPLTSIGSPTDNWWGNEVVTDTLSELAIVSIAEIPGIEVLESLEYTEGILFTSSKVSHLDACSPYSKSVSIRFSGLDTRNLCTGSISDSPASIFVSCPSSIRI